MDSFEDLYGFVLGSVRVVETAQIVGLLPEHIEAKDGMEPTAESRRQKAEETLSVLASVKEDRCTTVRRSAALDREFWESQS